ncbi:MAG: SPOR domain-containing protein [Salinivirgaceae bacterium]|nr:SPOR domain-containing protein [Salinivirgaceae bacterium]
MISKYIKRIIETELKDNNKVRVIIPTFGALLVDGDTNGIKDIRFNSYLKWPDGVIVNEMIKNGDVKQSSEGQTIINKFIEEVKQTTNKGEAYPIADLGYFTRNQQDLVFVVGEMPKNNATENVAEETPKTEQPLQAEDSEQAEQQIEIEPMLEPEPEETTEQKSEPAETTSTTKKETTTITNNYQKMEIKTKSNVGKIAVIVAIVVILVATAWAVYSFGLLNNLFKSKTEPAPVQEVVVDTMPAIDTVAVDSVEVVDVEEEVAVEEPTQIDPNARMFYVVAGSFMEAKYAEAYSQKLSSEGFTTRVVVGRSGFNYVTLGAFETRPEAVSMMREQRNQFAEQLWILYK